MTIDRRALWVLLIALLAIVVLVAVSRAPFGGGDDGTGPGACPPGHVTSTGCAKP
jgi:ABC-type cobalt transport system substrate-binding protein